jgi:hypothetical protein
MTYHCVCVRMAKINNSNNAKCWQGYRGATLTHCLCDVSGNALAVSNETCELATDRGRKVKGKGCSHKQCTQILLAAWLITAKAGHGPTSSNGWMVKLWKNQTRGQKGVNMWATYPDCRHCVYENATSKAQKILLTEHSQNETTIEAERNSDCRGQGRGK